jgi:hypothetical protein
LFGRRCSKAAANGPELRQQQGLGVAPTILLAGCSSWTTAIALVIYLAPWLQRAQGVVLARKGGRVKYDLRSTTTTTILCMLQHYHGTMVHVYVRTMVHVYVRTYALYVRTYHNVTSLCTHVPWYTCTGTSFPHHAHVATYVLHVYTTRQPQRESRASQQNPSLLTDVYH